MSRPLHVLVVEDRDEQAKALCEALEAFDAARQTLAESCRTLADAVARIERGESDAAQAVDAVVLDLDLPDAAELEALLALRKRWLAMPIVVVSGIGVHREQEIFDAGGCDFFAKGLYEPRALCDAVRKSVVRRAVFMRMKPVKDSCERTGRAISEAREALAEMRP